MAKLVRYLLVSGVACITSLSSTSARADHDTAEPYLTVMAGGHSMLLPGYVSIVYYAVRSDKPMPLGWFVPNLVTSLLGASLGVVGMVAWTHAPTIELHGTHPLAIPAAISLLVGPSVVLGASALQTFRTPAKSSPDPAKNRAGPPMIVVPTASMTREHGTTFSLAAIGAF